MFGLLKRLLGDSDSRGADNRARRSVTADVLGNGVRSPAKTKPRAGTASRGASDEFDPYNTGKFDRSASWERISRSHR